MVPLVDFGTWGLFSRQGKEFPSACEHLLFVTFCGAKICKNAKKNAQNILNFCHENKFKFRTGCFTDAIESQAFLDCNDTQLISVVQSGCVCVCERVYMLPFFPVD